MNKRYSRIYIAAAGFLALASLASCRKFTEMPGSPTSLTEEQAFSDSANANASITGIYIGMIGTGNQMNTANGSVSLYTGFSADEFDATSTAALYKDFYSNAIQVTNQSNATIWTTGYKYIYQANACIEGATASKGLSVAMKDKIIGEAKFLRAFYHFTLMNIYGKVPVCLTTDYRVTSVLSRADTAVVYKQVVDDLEDAYTRLLNDPAALNKARPNKYTVKALLARVYLFRKQWANAEAAASLVLGGNYSLVKNVDSVIYTNNREAIWQIPAAFAGTETVEANFMVPTGTTPNFIATTPLLNSYEAGDKRRAQWFATTTTNFTYPFKYKTRTVSGATAINPKEAHTEFRLAEQYLIRAEARVYLSNPDGARQDIDSIRLRAGLQKTTASGTDDLIKAIMQERRVELFGEWGHRWFDLKRTNTINAVLSAVKPSWQSNAALFPIPYNETQLNPFLEPNP